MAMVRCKECGAIISDKAKSCPICGDPKKNWLGAVFCLGILVLMFLGVKSCIGNSLDRVEKLNSSSQHQKSETKVSYEAPANTESWRSAWHKKPALPSDLNSEYLKISGEKVCSKAVKEKTASDFYEDCYKYIILSIKRIEQLNSQNHDSDYVNYIYPSCYYSGTGGKWIGDKDAVNANIVKACLEIQMSYLKWINWYSESFGKEEVLSIANKHRGDFYSSGSWFSAYGELLKTFGPPQI